MTEQKHVLEIYEPYDYQGANPLSVAGVAVVDGPMRDHYYLVKLDDPVDMDTESVEQLLIQPRYNGDAIDRAVSSSCTVNIARVVTDSKLPNGGKISFDDFVRWGVGKIHPPS